MPISLLAHTPFESFLAPGLLLGGIGAACAAAALLAWRRARAAIDATIVAGGALAVRDFVAERALLREASWLQAVYGALGLALLGLGARAGWRSRLPRHRVGDCGDGRPGGGLPRAVAGGHPDGARGASRGRCRLSRRASSRGWRWARARRARSRSGCAGCEGTRS